MNDFWESPENVARFAAREPDMRLMGLVPGFADPSVVRVLDLGCAGGRNADFLARRGFDVCAVDASEAMVAETRRRLASHLGDEQAERRVRVGRMDNLDWAPDASFELVVALGVYHCAQSFPEWDRALSETARVLAPRGKLLVSVFTPETRSSEGRNRPARLRQRAVCEGLDPGEVRAVDRTGKEALRTS